MTGEGGAVDDNGGNEADAEHLPGDAGAGADGGGTESADGGGTESGGGGPGSGGERNAVRLLQGYLWHPRDAALDLGEYLPHEFGADIHLLWDPLPQAPFAFFDDGTLSATQQVYQFTALLLTDESDEEAEASAARLVPWLAAKLQELLERTPPGVGWQLFEDLRKLQP